MRQEQEPDQEPAEGDGSAAVSPDPLDLSVPLAELEDGPGDPDRDDAGDVLPADTAADAKTWPGPGTGSVPAVDPPAQVAGVDEQPPAGGWRALVRSMRPRANRSQVLVAVLCAALGFALVVQVQQSAQDPLSSAREDDLVRLLDEVTQRSEQLADEVTQLSETRDELQSGSGQAQAAVDLAEERSGSEGILSGRLPAVGPGLEVVVRDRDGGLQASHLFNMLEEMRNAGAEVVELNGIRLVTSTWFRDTDAGLVVDGQEIGSPFRWTVIGDPATLGPALEIPGGALAVVRNNGAEVSTSEQDEVEVDAVRDPEEPQYATPQSPAG